MKTHKLSYRVLTIVVSCVLLLPPTPASATVESASIQKGQSEETIVLASSGIALRSLNRLGTMRAQDFAQKLHHKSLSL